MTITCIHSSCGYLHKTFLTTSNHFFKKASMEEGRSLEMPPADKLFVVDSLLKERKSLFSGDVATHGLPMPLYVTPLLCVCRER